MQGYARVARHEIIANRFEAIGQCQDKLEKLIGSEEANKTVALTYIRIMDGEVVATLVDQTKETETCEIGSSNESMTQYEKKC
jgi:hypothetical protein